MNARNTFFSLIAVLAVALVTVLAAPAGLFAQDAGDTPAAVQHGPNFVDENGDGYNDNAPDHDGDGIPNGRDADWTRPSDGSGQKSGKAQQGIGRQGKGKGLQNGTRNIFRTRLRDGSGANCTGTGECDGTGPKGAGARGAGRGRK